MPDVLRSIRRVPPSDLPPCGLADPEAGHRCTLPAGHTGWHLAADADGEELAYWPAQ